MPVEDYLDRLLASGMMSFSKMMNIISESSPFPGAEDGVLGHCFLYASGKGALRFCECWACRSRESRRRERRAFREEDAAGVS